jgi:hypothetical protein
MTESGDYISRKAANEACREAVRRYPNSFYNGIEAARDAIRKLPAADVRPVRRGKWIQTTQPMGWRDEDCAECSVCGEDFVLDEWAMDEFTNLMNFCPNCGATMLPEPPEEEGE